MPLKKVIAPLFVLLLACNPEKDKPRPTSPESRLSAQARREFEQALSSTSSPNIWAVQQYNPSRIIGYYTDSIIASKFAKSVTETRVEAVKVYLNPAYQELKDGWRFRRIIFNLDETFTLQNKWVLTRLPDRAFRINWYTQTDAAGNSVGVFELVDNNWERAIARAREEAYQQRADGWL
jgi:hypothetical protein